MTSGARGVTPGVVVLALAATLTSLGCGGTPGETGDAGASFVAFAADFVGFSTWEHVRFESATAAGSTHVAGTRDVYVNRKPPAGATTYPVGTIIVKVTGADGKIFARVKRGGTFNAKGAVGWEWFELLETAQHDVVVKWRGVGPPLGEVYGGDPNAGCNLCHKIATASDYVLSPGLGIEPGALDPDGGVDGAPSPDAGEAATMADAGTDTESDASPHE